MARRCELARGVDGDVVDLLRVRLEAPDLVAVEVQDVQRAVEGAQREEGLVNAEARGGVVHQDLGH